MSRLEAERMVTAAQDISRIRRDLLFGLEAEEVCEESQYRFLGALAAIEMACCQLRVAAATWKEHDGARS